MKFEIFEIPIENMGTNNEKVECIKIIINKLHTHQEFCANEKIDITLDHNNTVYNFYLYKGRRLYINNKDCTEYEYNTLKMLADNLPTTTFVSKYNLRLKEYIVENYINKNLRIRPFNGCYSGGEDYSYTDFDIDSECSSRSYIYLISATIEMNRVVLMYKEFSIVGNHSDYMRIRNDGYHTCVVNKAWENSYDSTEFMTKEKFYEKLDYQIKNDVFEYAVKSNKALSNMAEKINEL